MYLKAKHDMLANLTRSSSKNCGTFFSIPKLAHPVYEAAETKFRFNTEYVSKRRPNGVKMKTCSSNRHRERFFQFFSFVFGVYRLHSSTIALSCIITHHFDKHSSTYRNKGYRESVKSSHTRKMRKTTIFHLNFRDKREKSSTTHILSPLPETEL